MKITMMFMILIGMATPSYAGPNTNKVEYEGDALLTKQQQQEYSHRLEQGIHFFENGQYDLAEAEFKTILTFAPKKALAYFNLGLTKYKQGNFTEAIKHFDTVIKMKSYYVGAAFYYKAIAQYNLGDAEAAIKTAERYTEARYFYDLSQALIQTIKTGSDEYFENAKLAFADSNFELCLLEMDLSVLSDSPKGKELITQCKEGLKATSKAEKVLVPTLPPEVEKRYANKFHLDSYVSQTDNVYQKATTPLSKTTYFGEVGGEFLLKNKIESGIGALYNQSNGIDIAQFKDETYSAYIPINFSFDNHRFLTETFYNLNKYDGADSFSDSGIFAIYLHSMDKYTLGLSGSAHKKKSLNSLFEFKDGTYSNARLMVSRYFDQFAISANLAYEHNLSGDQSWGSFILPYANNTTKYGLNFIYNLSKTSEFSLKTLFSVVNYMHKLSPNNIFRKDMGSSYILKYQYNFNQRLSTYVSQSLVQNKSNYDITEGVDKNYVEHLTTLGLSLVTY